MSTTNDRGEASDGIYFEPSVSKSGGFAGGKDVADRLVKVDPQRFTELGTTFSKALQEFRRGFVAEGKDAPTEVEMTLNLGVSAGANWVVKAEGSASIQIKLGWK